MKKLICAILTLVMMSASCMVFATTPTPASYTLDITDITQTTAGNSKTTTVSVKNYGDDPVPYVTLVVAVKNKVTGEVVDISMDDETNVTGDVVLSASATLPDATGYIYEYFVWDNLDNMIQIGNEAPQMPQNLKVESVSNSSVTLSWDAAKDDAGVLTYNIFCGGEKVGNTTATTYTHYGLEESTDYSYSISAQDGAGLETEKSAEVTATTENLATVNISDLPEEWQESGIAEGNTAGNDGLDITGLALTSTALPQFVERDAFNSVSTLAENTYNIGDYFGRVAYASNEMSSGKYGMIFMIPSGSPLRTTNGDNTRSIVFDYYDNGTSPINIRYRHDTGSVWKEITAITRTNTNTWKTCVVTVNDAVFIANNMHLIFATNTGNGDIYISKVGICKNYVPKAEMLSAPTNLTATDVTEASVTIEWDAVESVRGDNVFYNIYRDGALIEEGIEETVYTDTGLTLGEEYSYSVEAYTCDDNKAKSGEYIIKTSAAPAPTGFSIDNAATTISSITLEWNKVDGADGYYIYYEKGETVSSDGFETIDVNDGTAESYTVTGLDDGTKYSFKISGYTDGIETEKSDVKTAETRNIPSILMADIALDTKTNSAGTTKGKLSETDEGYDGIACLGGYIAGMNKIESASEFSDSVDGQYGIIEYEGETCYAVEGNPNNKVLLRFHVDDSIITSDDNDVTFIVTYYDNSEEPIKFNYYKNIMNSDNLPTDSGSQVLVERTGTNEWKTASVTFDNVYFGNKGRAFDFYLQIITSPYFIKKIEVVPTTWLVD